MRSPAEVATSTQRASPNDPVASRTAPSASGLAAEIVYPTPSITAVNAPTDGASSATSSGSVITSGKRLPTANPNSAAQSQPQPPPGASSIPTIAPPKTIEPETRYVRRG